MLEWLEWLALLDAFIEGSKRFFESTFITALVGSLAGALGGAWAAQRIAERTKLKDDLLKEIRNVNAAATLAYGIANSFLAVKKQHVKRLYDDFCSQKAALEEHQAKRKAGELDRSALFDFKADFEFLSPINVPIGPLQTQVFEKISVSGRPLGLAGILAQTISGLNGTIELRNSQIRSIRGADLSNDALVAVYFGLRTEKGVDQTYSSTVEGIHSHTDDCIYFSKLLGDDLCAHGNRAKERFQKRFRGPAPFVASCDFSKADKEGLMPPVENYASWQSMFVSPAPVETGRRATASRLSSKILKVLVRPNGAPPK